MRSKDEAAGARIVRGAMAGLIAGVVAALAMDRFQALVALAAPADDAAAPATVQAADALKTSATGTPLAKAQQALAGQLIHYAVGAALGVGYGIVAEFRPAVTTGFGSVFAIGIAGLLDEAAVPAMGFAPPPWKTAAGTHVYSATSHLVFGIVAELTRGQVRSTLLPKG